MIFEHPQAIATSTQKFSEQEVLDYIKSLSAISKSGWFIAGSFPTAIKVECHWNDLDIFFENEETYILFLEHYKQHKFRWSSGNADCYEVIEQKSVYLRKVLDVNLVKRFGTIEQVLDTFDLNVCRNALTPELELISMCDTNVIKIKTGRTNTLNRVLKYITKGFEFYDYDLLFEMIMSNGSVFSRNDARTYDFGDVPAQDVRIFSSYSEMYDFVLSNVIHALGGFENSFLVKLDKIYTSNEDILKYIDSDVTENIFNPRKKLAFNLLNTDLKMVLHYKFNYDFTSDIDLFKEKYPEYYL